LLRRAEREEARQEESSEQEPLIDAMTWLEPAHMGELTEEQRQRARELFVAESDKRPPGWMSAEQWKRERREILAGERDWAQPGGSRYPVRAPRRK
jgi:hypothetical protein